MWTTAVLFLEVATGVEVQRMVFYGVVKKNTHVAADLLNTRVAKLFYPATFDANEVVVLLITVRPLKLGHVFAKLMLGYEVASQQQVEGVVHRSPAHPVVAVFHLDVKRFHIKMVVTRINLLQNSEALRGFAVTMFFEIGRKNELYFFYEFINGLHSSV